VKRYCLCGKDFQWAILMDSPLSYKRLPNKLTLVPITRKQEKSGPQKEAELNGVRELVQNKNAIRPGLVPRPIFVHENVDINQYL